MDFSKIIIGVMRWGIWGANLSKNQVQKNIETALEEQLFTFDHADIYGGYTTEELFGEAFSEMNVERNQIQLISKCGIKYPSDKKNYSLKYYDYSKEYILKCVDESLENLKTDYLDVLLLHRPSPLMNPEEIAAAFSILRNQGKVLHFGVSNFTTSQFEMIHHYFPYLITNQIEISATETKAFYDGTIDQMMMRNIKPMAYSVLGDYFSEENDRNQRIQRVLEELKNKYNAEEAQLLLAFLLHHPSKILPVVGTSQPDNIRKLKKSIDIALQTEDWFRILEASQGKKVP